MFIFRSKTLFSLVFLKCWVACRSYHFSAFREVSQWNWSIGTHLDPIFCNVRGLKTTQTNPHVQNIWTYWHLYSDKTFWIFLTFSWACTCIDNGLAPSALPALTNNGIACEGLYLPNSTGPASRSRDSRVVSPASNYAYVQTDSVSMKTTRRSIEKSTNSSQSVQNEVLVCSVALGLLKWHLIIWFLSWLWMDCMFMPST